MASFRVISHSEFHEIRVHVGRTSKLQQETTMDFFSLKLYWISRIFESKNTTTQLVLLNMLYISNLKVYLVSPPVSFGVDFKTESMHAVLLIAEQNLTRVCTFSLSTCFFTPLLLSAISCLRRLLHAATR